MANLELNITEAKIDQIPIITRMWGNIDQCTPEPAFGGKTEASHSRATEIITHALDSPTACVLVALNEDRILGTITGHLYQRPAVKLSSVGVIYSLWVEPNYRRQGVGQALLEGIEQHLMMMGAEAFQVGWDTSNTSAGAWWQDRGYCAYETIASKTIRHL